MNRIPLIIACLGLILISSCGKEEEEAAVFKSPITILQPSTDPANVLKEAPIKYDVRFTNDEYIDSVMAFYQLDTLGTGYDTTQKDSLIHKVVYPISNRKNEQSIAGTFKPYKFPAVGKKIHLIFYMRSKTRNVSKRIPLIVS
jgi:hypothetical protein